MKQVWQRSWVFWLGVAILTLGVGGPMAVYVWVGGGELGVEAVTLSGLLPVMFLGFWLGVGTVSLGAILWFVRWRERDA